MRFANPHIFWLLLIVVGLIVIFVCGLYVQRRRLRQFGNPELLRSLMPNVSYIRPQLKFYMLIVALVLIIFALARPQVGSKLEKNNTTGVEIMMVLDVSNSMLATDVAPSRIENAKMMLSKIIDKMPDNRVGLIVFSGDAVVQLPMTADNVSAKMFLSTITTKTVANPGTAVGTALDLAIKSFGEENKDIGRSIILLTDGENHEDDAVAAAKLAREKGIMVNVVGFGSPQGSPIPVQGTMSFWKDKDGNVVVTKLNESMCQQIAQAGDGVYVRADNSNVALRTITQQLSQLKEGEIQMEIYSDYADRFYILAWIVLFLLLIEFFVLNRQNKYLNKYKWFE
jgi:Ca-activated chloride channel family protein